MINNKLIVPPKFNKNQVVHFIGGVGMILDLQVDSGTWKYAIEMEKGSETDIGSIGAETTILLHETDIDGVITERGKQETENGEQGLKMWVECSSL
jgi:hypothetical protein